MWIGGMVFLVVVLVPAIREPAHQAVASSLVHWTGQRFRWVGWVCLGLLILTGVFNLAYRGFGWLDLWNGQLWQGSFGTSLEIKLLLVAVILLLSVVHDFNIGPRASDLMQSNPASPKAARLRRQASWIGRLNLFLALAVVALGVMLVRGWP
ncbi:MAG: DUF4149 domain-containing protein [Candidatus Binatia bacterium]